MTLSFSPAPATADDTTLRIAVASNFQAAARDLAQAYAEESGIEVALSSAASGLLAAQILEGAPFDLFLSADEARPRAVIGTGEGRDAPVCYAQGSLVLLGSEDLTGALADASLSIAIANPRSAPYGAAALAVLERAGGAAGLQERRIIRGTNVQQALQFFERGATDLALVAKAVAPDRGIAVPPAWHPPILQYAVVTARGERAGPARAFLAFLQSDAAQARLAARGYGPCP